MAGRRWLEVGAESLVLSDWGPEAYGGRDAQCALSAVRRIVPRIKSGTLWVNTTTCLTPTCRSAAITKAASAATSAALRWSPIRSRRASACRSDGPVTARRNERPGPLSAHPAVDHQKASSAETALRRCQEEHG